MIDADEVGHRQVEHAERVRLPDAQMNAERGGGPESLACTLDKAYGNLVRPGHPRRPGIRAGR